MFKDPPAKVDCGLSHCFLPLLCLTSARDEYRPPIKDFVNEHVICNYVSMFFVGRVSGNYPKCPFICWLMITTRD